ncbi:MAG TPA: peptidase M14 [Deltaproteobacteria bacterium]|nr:peptidase M14 [Deltaproteobacteria bacterium]
MLQQLEYWPEDLYECETADLFRVLGGPSLIHVPGRREPALFVSVLLHGNESSGWLALRRLMEKYRGAVLPRSLSVLVGNVLAARDGLRCCPGQADYNRVWLAGTTPEHRMAAKVLEEMRRRGVFAGIDVHNNTGINPHYVCVNRLENSFFQLATLFSRTVVYFTKPEGVQTSAFAEFCPAVTLECGQPGEERGIAHAQEYLEACLHLAEIPRHPISRHDIDLYHTVAIVKLPDDVSIGFGKEAADFQLDADLDRLNFTELPEGTFLGRIRDGCEARLVVADISGREVGENYLDYRQGEIRTKVKLMPSMLTRNLSVIRQDCLGYFMERIEFEKPYCHPGEQEE